MIETIAIVVGGTITAVTLGSLWFVSVIDKRERAEDGVVMEGGEPRVRPYHQANADCDLCGQATAMLRVKAEGDLLRYTCTHCQGSYLTKSKK
jgi:hypothetical protein